MPTKKYLVACWEVLMSAGDVDDASDDAVSVEVEDGICDDAVFMVFIIPFL